MVRCNFTLVSVVLDVVSQHQRLEAQVPLSPGGSGDGLTSRRRSEIALAVQNFRSLEAWLDRG